MAHPRNGRTIRIPVRKVTPRLPAADEKKRSLLTGPSNEVEVKAEVEAEVEAEITDWKERALRAQAEAENVRKRAERQAKVQVQQERRRLLTRLLTIVDNLERALAHANENGDDPLHAGVQLTLEDLWAQLAQEEVEPIRALGQLFDPHLHEAVATDGSGGDMVVEVLQTGYTLDGELLRPARVIVGHLA